MDWPNIAIASIAPPVSAVIAFLLLLFTIKLRKAKARKGCRRAARRQIIKQTRRKVMAARRIKKDVKKEIILKCLKAGNEPKNQYFYSNALATKETGSSDRYMRRGVEFEQLVKHRITEALIKCPKVYLIYQWHLGDGICDFALVWQEKRGKKHAILIECKHSDSRNEFWKNKQLQDGMEQLKRYAKVVRKREKYKVDLLVLLVDFPIPGPVAVSFDKRIMTFNFSLLDEFVQGVKTLDRKRL